VKIFLLGDQRYLLRVLFLALPIEKHSFGIRRPLDVSR
jgi:hypothetical protein